MSHTPPHPTERSNSPDFVPGWYVVATSDDVKKVAAHEFFHLVQNWHTNWASTGHPNHSNDGWFLEGTASCSLNSSRKFRSSNFGAVRDRSTNGVS